MFLVGGFAESAILQMEMRKEFEHLLRILIPQDVGLTILKGKQPQREEGQGTRSSGAVC